MHYTSQPSIGDRVLVERINILRGLGILGVLLVHTSAHFTSAGGLSPVVFANVVVDVFAHYAVPLFVLLSGLTLGRRFGPATVRFSSESLYRRRLLKILPAYLVFSLLNLALFSIEYAQAPGLTWGAFLVLTGSAYYHLWFVALLVQLYLLFPLLCLVILRARRHVGLLLLVALLLQLAWNLGASLLAAALPQRPLFSTLLSNRIFFSHIFYFKLGMVAGLNPAAFDRRVRAIPPAPLKVTCVASVTVTAGIRVDAIRAYGSLDAAPPAALVIGVIFEPLLFLATIVLLWQCMPWLQRGNRSIRQGVTWLGIMSFPIYLVHVFFQWVLERSMAPFGLTAGDVGGSIQSCWWGRLRSVVQPRGHSLACRTASTW
jgi:peptidoglycan/LPS O-acetylase OafA/YrhL